MLFLAEGEKWKLLAELEGDVWEYKHKGIEGDQEFKYALVAVDKNKKKCKPVQAEVK
ncbi:hypothetical protein ES703_26568 [subsurface metagenome]